MQSFLKTNYAREVPALLPTKLAPFTPIVSQVAKIPVSSLAPFEDKSNLWWKLAPNAFILSNATPIGIIQLPHFMNSNPIRRDFIHQAVLYEKSWQKAQYHTTKTLSMVRGSSRKPHPQKGTGRARQGSVRAPQLSKGYKPHSHVPADRTLDINQSVYDRAILHAFSAKFKQSQFIVVDLLDNENIKALGYDNVLGLYGRTMSIPVCENDAKMLFVNIRHVSVMKILEYEYIVIDKEGLELLEEKYGKYNPVL